MIEKDIIQQATALARANRVADALALLNQAHLELPHSAHIAHLLASVLEHNKQLVEACSTAAKAVKLDPHQFAYQAHAMQVHKAIGKLEAASVYGLKAIKLRPNDAVIHNDVGLILYEMARHDEAIKLFEQAIALNPKFANPHNNLGLTLTELGEFDRAKAEFEMCLTLEPTMSHVIMNLLGSYNVTARDDPHLLNIEAKLTQPNLLSEDRMLLNFAAAKAHNDLGDKSQFLTHALAAAALKRATLTYDEPTMLAYFEHVEKFMTREFISTKEGSGFKSPLPIFVIGMPRSGSTLIEQILASHPRVSGGGELPDLNFAVTETLEAFAATRIVPDFLADAFPALLEQMGRTYVGKLTTRAAGADFVVDKMLTNFLVVGLIHLIMPNAKIIHARRNPLDTCVSCFSKHFASDLPHTYDLGELGRYYRAYHKLMKHWHSVLPEGRILDVDYEQVVGDFETQARRLLDHCGLEWTDQVLSFHETKRAVRTLSLAQVRKPIYKTSIRDWSDHREQLRPLFDALGDLAS